MTLLVHEDKQAEYLFLKDGNVPDPSSVDNGDFKILLTIIKCQLEGGDMDKCNKIGNARVGLSEDISTRVNYMYTI